MAALSPLLLLCAGVVSPCVVLCLKRGSCCSRGDGHRLPLIKMHGDRDCCVVLETGTKTSMIGDCDEVCCLNGKRRSLCDLLMSTLICNETR